MLPRNAAMRAENISSGDEKRPEKAQKAASS
jgi:hypothetical protein